MRERFGKLGDIRRGGLGECGRQRGRREEGGVQKERKGGVRRRDEWRGGLKENGEREEF